MLFSITLSSFPPNNGEELLMDTQSHERLLQTLSALLIQVNALQTLVAEEQTEDIGGMGIQHIRET